MVTATFRFYEELDDFLAPERRWQTLLDPSVRQDEADRSTRLRGAA